MINDILDLSKIEAGKIELEITEVPLDQLVRDTLGLVGGVEQGEARRVGDVDVRGEVPVNVRPIRTDAGKLKQVLINLIGNALKFTPEGGRITVSAERDGRFVRVSVTDTGYGIAPEDIPKLFKKFQQVDLARQKAVKFAGTGLGLSICKTVVEAHGGKIWAESEKGRGASFKFTVPVSGMDAASGEGV